MFSRLEESRVKLEQELGCDTFIKAYKAVQVLYTVTADRQGILLYIDICPMTIIYPT